jgi:hypothetical protein
MPTVINLQSSPEILWWTVNLTLMNVTVHYLLRETSGRVYLEAEEVFWVTIPSLGNDPATGQPISVPSNWSQLPQVYVQTLGNLTSDAATAITNKYLT